MSFVLLGILNSQALAGGWTPGPYFISTYGDSNTMQSSRIALDSSDNCYVVGRGYPGSGGYDAQMYSLTSTGTPRWTKKWGGGTNEDVTDVAIDSSDNIYVTGYQSYSVIGGDDNFVTKMDTSGNQVWTRRCSDGTYGNDEGEGIGVDSSGNVYAASWYTNVRREFHIHKRNSSGTLQWQRYWGDGASFSTDCYGSHTTAGGDTYAVGYTNSASGFGAAIVKFNSSGTYQWGKVIDDTGVAANDSFYSVTTDSSGNVYACGYTSSQGAGGNDALVVSWTSAGTLRWQKILGDSSSNFWRDIAVDSNDNIAVVGKDDTLDAVMLAKYDSAGNLLFQRTWDTPSGDNIGTGIAFDSNDDIWINVNTNASGAGNYDMGVFYIPGDGSRTSEVVLDGATWTYAESSYTSATSTLSNNSDPLSNGTASLTDASFSFSFGTWSFTQYLELV